MKKIKSIRGYTEDEKADAFIYPVEPTSTQLKEAKDQLSVARIKSRKNMTADTALSLKLLQLKFQLEGYLQNKEFNPDLNFGYFLRQYVNLRQIKRKDFASEISIKDNLLSQFINRHRNPPEYISIRLEIHSNNIIPATYWFKLIQKQREFELKMNKEIRKREMKFVNRRLAVVA